MRKPQREWDCVWDAKEAWAEPPSSGCNPRCRGIVVVDQKDVAHAHGLPPSNSQSVTHHLQQRMDCGFRLKAPTNVKVRKMLSSDQKYAWLQLKSRCWDMAHVLWGRSWTALLLEFTWTVMSCVVRFASRRDVAE